jgi:hypothetical protein
MLKSIYKANVLASCAYALASLFVCSTYELFHPHAVGHLAPAASVLVAVIWSLHCWQLGLAVGIESKRAMRVACAPFAIALMAGLACWVHYNQEYAEPYAALQPLREAAA